MHTLAERTYVNADSTKVVPEGSPDAAFLLGNEGDEISEETATRLGLNVSTAYADQKVADLRALATERGLEVEGGSKATKADLIDALETSDAAAAAAPGTADVSSPADA